MKLTFTILALVITNTVFGVPPIYKAKAKAAIAKTNRAIYVALKAVKTNKVYSGNLGKAIKHQRYAKKLYINGEYAKSFYHTRRARMLAREALKANRGTANLDFNESAEEKEFAKDSPSDGESDAMANQEYPSEIKDEDIVNMTNLDLEVQ
ncbi:MAG: hypothetical protein NZ529_02295 [Cytophagaceae bacterium]|nr:hypothetical protein [Cytophagaceae bacterium]MDW8455599.1 hypothetical protein [Cytophagaceae bacterium]